MPYIVTPGMQTTDAGTGYESTAVETIEDARDLAWELVKAKAGPNAATPAMRDLCESVRETDSHIGPMPDGFVIDVQFVSYGNLWKLTTGSKSGQPVDTKDIIDAFNDR
jgi:hypothetical protein